MKNDSQRMIYSVSNSMESSMNSIQSTNMKRLQKMQSKLEEMDENDADYETKKAEFDKLDAALLKSLTVSFESKNPSNDPSPKNVNTEPIKVEQEDVPAKKGTGLGWLIGGIFLVGAAALGVKLYKNNNG